MTNALRTGPIAVVGSLNMDLVIRVPRFPAAGETLTGREFETVPGGKGANQAVACARMGAPVVMIGSIGADGHGKTLVAALRADGIDVAGVHAWPDAHTGIAIVMVEDGGQNCIVLAPGANAALDPAAIDAAAPDIARAALLVLQLEVPMDTVLHAAQCAKRAGVPVLLNAAPVAPLPEGLWPLIDWLVVNEIEAGTLAGVAVSNAQAAAAIGQALRDRGAKNVIVTLGEMGVVVADANGTRHFAAQRVRAIDSTAAGDTFIGALAAGMREGLDIDAAVALGQAASALCVTRRGAQPSIPTRAELGSGIEPPAAGAL